MNFLIKGCLQRITLTKMVILIRIFSCLIMDQIDQENYLKDDLKVVTPETAS